MAGWTCGRCTFVNHELMENCEMCEAPKEAAELPHVGEPEPARDAGDDIAMSVPEGTRVSPPDTFSPPPPEGTSHLPAEDWRAFPAPAPEPANPCQSLMDTEIDMPSSSSSSMTTHAGGDAADSGPQSVLPEPLAPVVVHERDNEDTAVSTNIQLSLNQSLTGGASTQLKKVEENGWSFLDNEIRIVLIGKTGVGKSTTGNNILDTKAFESSASGSSVTSKCQMGWGNRFTRDIQVIDTPGLFDTGMSNIEITREVVKCVGMTSPGPHAFVLVIRLDRFTAEEKDTVDHFIKIFGKEMLKYLIVLFTRKDDLKHDGITLDQYVQDVPPDLKELLVSCDNRCLAIDNRTSREETQEDVVELLQLVERMVKTNGGGHYTNEMYEEAEKIIIEQEEERIKKSREKMEKEMQRLREEVEQELRQQEEEKQKSLGNMRTRLTEIGISPDDEEWVEVFGCPSMEADGPASLRPQQQSLPFSPGGPQSTSVDPQVQTGPAGSGHMPQYPVTVEATPAHSGSEQQPLSLQETSTRDAGNSTRDAGNSTRDAGNPAQPAVMPSSGPHSLKSEDPAEAEGRRREALELRHSLERLEEEQNTARDRMRERYKAKQAEAFETYQCVHKEERKRTRREMEDTNSGIFSRILGVVKRIFRTITEPIGRAINSLMGY